MNAELRAELATPPGWMYDWELGDGVEVPLLHPELPSVHQTRLELLEADVRTALAAAGPDATALDVACCEGWFAHRLLEWGAARVVGVDIRPGNIRRAKLVRDQFGIAPERLELICEDVFALDPARLGSFDVVLCLGLVYHLENPVGALRAIRPLTRSLCVVESQLTEQRESITSGGGVTGIKLERPASFAAWHEPEQETQPLASHGGILSLVPNEAALLEMLRVAGFTGVRIADPAPWHNAQYRHRERAVALAGVSEP